MKKNDPLLPVRRAVGNSVNYLKALRVAEDQVPTNARNLRFENLEDRRVLSATGWDPGASPESDSGFFTTADDGSNFGFQQDDSISYLRLLVNGEEVNLGPNNNILNLTAGDTVEVAEIGVHTGASEGVFAAEGYVNKIGDLTSASLIDYNDGRFSDRDDNFAANGGDGVIEGLNNTWTVEAGWDRMTINLLHYTETATEVAGRFFVNMQVGVPDFELDTETLDQILDLEITVGDEVKIPGAWLNHQSGLFHNYAEVDIYHEQSGPETIIWAGALVGNAGDSVKGEFVNTREGDGFSERFTPDAAGVYTLKYYVDPENFAAESNEANNQYEIRLTVKDLAPIAVDDKFEDSSGPLNVLENDIPTHEEETHYAEDFESDNLTWTTNANGTDTATSGLWEATDPVGTSWNGVQLQLEDAAQGQRALVTGGDDDGTVGFDDVDGGVTSALSEAIAVPADGNVELSFKYTFAHLNNSSAEDFFRVTVIGESSTQIVLEELGDASGRGGQWTDFTFSLAEFAGQDIQLMVEAGDLGEGSLVEAGIDDVAVTTPETPFKINEFSQGQNGKVTLNDDGTFNYAANAGFSGNDTFTYNLTDGNAVSNTATVTVNVEAKELDVESQATGDEDSSIEIQIKSNYDQVQISNVPDDAFLNRGQAVGNGVYVLDANELEGLTVTPGQNSDVDFVLVVTPGENGSFNDQLAQKIEVVVNAVVDGGEVTFFDFGILTGSSGEIPVTSEFIDKDGSESHKITLAGVPDFVKFSAGSFDGENWILDSSDLNSLEISAGIADDTTGWTDYFGRYNYKIWDLKFQVESAEANGIDSLFTDGTFKFTTWQRI